MGISVTFSDDPASVLRTAGEFLASNPVLHNMILSLLHARVAHPEPGRYWVAADKGSIVGLAFQSPLTIAATLTPMTPGVAAAMVDAIADAGVALPGVNGEAATAASFAGHWTERCKSSALPSQGMRIYELSKPVEGGAIAGKLRKAVSTDRNWMVAWAVAFHAEIAQPIGDPEPFVDRWLSAGQLWLWDKHEAVSMAVSREPVAGVVRVSGVYTPPEHRRHGYAEACVRGLSKSFGDEGYRCMLYTVTAPSRKCFVIASSNAVAS